MKLDQLKTLIHDIKTLSRGLDHSRPYSHQLPLLGAIDRAMRAFETEAAAVESYAYMNLPRLKAAKVRFKMIEVRKKIKNLRPS